MTSQYIFEVQILFLNILKYQLVIKNVSNIKQRIPSFYQDQFCRIVPNFNLISALCTDFFLEIMSEILSEWIGFVESIIQKGTGRI